MHTRSIEIFQHSHVFLGETHERNERKTWAVILVCAAMMVAEIFNRIQSLLSAPRRPADTVSVSKITEYFMQVAANHVAVFQPFLTALAQLLLGGA